MIGEESFVTKEGKNMCANGVATTIIGLPFKFSCFFNLFFFVHCFGDCLAIFCSHEFFSTMAKTN